MRRLLQVPARDADPQEVAPDRARRDDEGDVMRRALVRLTESQNGRIAGLKRVSNDLRDELQARIGAEILLANEIRTPLALVCSVLHLLKDDIPADTRASLVERGLAEAGSIIELADNLLDPARDDAPLLRRARLSTATVRELVNEAIVGVGHLDPGRVRSMDDADLDLEVATEPARVVAILVALLDNAGTHGGDGPIDIAATVSTDRLVAIQVADSGPGLPRGLDVEDVFEPFADGDSGSGLFLARMLARSLGGDVDLVERPGGGVVAGLWLPQRRRDDPVAPDRRSPAKAAKPRAKAEAARS